MTKPSSLLKCRLSPLSPLALDMIHKTKCMKVKDRMELEFTTLAHLEDSIESMDQALSNRKAKRGNTRKTHAKGYMVGRLELWKCKRKDQSKRTIVKCG